MFVVIAAAGVVVVVVVVVDVVVVGCHALLREVLICHCSAVFVGGARVSFYVFYW